MPPPAIAQLSGDFRAQRLWPGRSHPPGGSGTLRRPPGPDGPVGQHSQHIGQHIPRVAYAVGQEPRRGTLPEQAAQHPRRQKLPRPAQPLFRPAAQGEDQVQVGGKGSAAQIIVEMAAQQISRRRPGDLRFDPLIYRVQGQGNQDQRQVSPPLPGQQREKMISATSTAPTTPQKPSPPFSFICTPPLRAV